MFGSTRNVFKSRWHALWWAAGVLVTAYCSLPQQPSGGSQADQDAADKAQAQHEAQQVQQIMAGVTAAQRSAAGN